VDGTLESAAHKNTHLAGVSSGKNRFRSGSVRCPKMRRYPAGTNPTDITKDLARRAAASLDHKGTGHALNYPLRIPSTAHRTLVPFATLTTPPLAGSQQAFGAGASRPLTLPRNVNAPPELCSSTTDCAHLGRELNNPSSPTPPRPWHKKLFSPSATRPDGPSPPNGIIRTNGAEMLRTTHKRRLQSTSPASRENQHRNSSPAGTTLPPFR